MRDPGVNSIVCQIWALYLVRSWNLVTLNHGFLPPPHIQWSVVKTLCWCLNPRLADLSAETRPEHQPNFNDHPIQMPIQFLGDSSGLLASHLNLLRYANSWGFIGGFQHETAYFDDFPAIHRIMGPWSRNVASCTLGWESCSVQLGVPSEGPMILQRTGLV